MLQEYRWIIDAYVSDFYTHNHWHKLLHSVQEYFDAVEPPDLAWMLDISRSEQHPLSKSVIPLSLLALHCCIQNLSLKTAMIDLDSMETRSCLSLSLCPGKTGDIRDTKAAMKKTCMMEAPASYKPNYKNGQCMDMQHIFRRHVKPKKQHEIDKLGQVISFLSQLTSCSNVVDVGAGLGHLSRLLTFQHGLRVTTVEAADGHSPVAAAYDRKLQEDIQKANEKRKSSTEPASSDKTVHILEDISTVNSHTSQYEALSSLSNLDNSNDHIDLDKLCDTRCLSHSSENVPSHASKFSENESKCDLQSLFVSSQKEKKCHIKSVIMSSSVHVIQDCEDVLPNHVVSRVHPDISSAQFLDIIRQRAEADNGSEDETFNNFILVGLHACGDLTPTLLRVFINCETAVALASVACCYTKMSSSRPNCSTTVDNYPMSKYVNGLHHYQLSYAARELACHFADAYIGRLKDNSPQLKIHSLRAALQYLIKAINPAFTSGTVRIITKKKAQCTFLEYARENLKKVNIDIESVPQDIIEHCEHLHKHWKRVVTFYTLRLSLAPAIETLLLLDRALFLLENGVQCAVVPVFDSTFSPRNFAVLAVKS